jgi:hypothetical protein
MPVELRPTGTSVIDVLDHVLDKGVVIDAWVRVSLVGIDLVTIRARVVVASIETHLKMSETLSRAGIASMPAGEVRADEAAVSEDRPPERPVAPPAAGAMTPSSLPRPSRFTSTGSGRSIRTS